MALTAGSSSSQQLNNKEEEPVPELTTCRNFKCDFKCIPESLSFDMVIRGGTCSPCSVRNFMDYLIYVEHAAENLQFFLWFKDYARRFAMLPESHRVLSPRWTEKVSYRRNRRKSLGLKQKQQDAASWKSFSPDDAPLVGPPEFSPGHQDIDSRPQSSAVDTPTSAEFDHRTLSLKPSLSSMISKLDEDNQDINEAGAVPSGSIDYLHPYSTQPFRKEVSRIVAIYLAEGSPRELNLTDEERSTILRALKTTTHPSAFDHVADGVEWQLRHQSHPNFIKWTLANSNNSRCLLARIVSITACLAGIAAGVVPILSGAARAWRIFSVVLLVPSLSVLLTAWDGTCLFFLFRKRRHMNPWEFFTEVDEIELHKLESNGKAFDVFGEANSYEDEPWIPKYQDRRFLRKVFDPEAEIEDPAFRRLQNALLYRAITLAVAISAILIGIMIAIPRYDLF